MLLLFDRHPHCIEMPFIGEVRTFATKLIGVLLPEFLAPLPHRFIRHLDPAIQHHVLDLPIAQGKPVVEPNTVANNFAGESMTGVQGSAIVNGVESVRLFYLWAKLTIPAG